MGLPDNLRSPSLLRAWLILTLCLTLFVVWPGADDPWWRPKECTLFGMGLLWCSFRCAARFPILRSARLWLPACVLTWMVFQFFLKALLPFMSARGAVVVRPWLFLAFFHWVVVCVWFTDCVSFLRIGDLRFIAAFISWAGVVLSLYMIGQSFGIDPAVWALGLRFEKVIWLHDNHIIGLMGGPFQAAAVLAALIPAMLAVHPLLMVLGIVPLWLSGSASAVGAAFAGALVIIRVRWPRLFLPAVLSAACALLIQGRTLMSDYLTRFAPIWKQSVEAALQQPFLGRGLGSYKMLGIQDANSVVRWAHNDWLQLWVEAGILPVVLLAAWVGSLLVQRFKTPFIWQATLVSTLFLSLFNTPFHQAPNIMIALISLIALAIHKEDLRNA